MQTPKYVLGFLIIVWLISCMDENSTYGEKLTTSKFRTVSIDTLTVKLTTMRFDSLETSGTNRVMVGEYKHSLWGKVTAGSYLPYQISSYSVGIDENILFDSLTVRFKYQGYSIGDTLETMRINVHELSNKVRLNRNGYLYNNNKVAYESTLLGTATFRPRPGYNDSVNVRLDDSLGEELLEMFHRRHPSVTSTELFEDKFKGLAIVPATGGCNSIVNFAISDSSSVMVLHYRVTSEIDSPRQLIFKVNTDTQFNSIEQDRTGTILANASITDDKFPSAALGNRGFMFAGLGWYTNIEFPYLNNLTQQGEQIEVASSNLKIYPEYPTYMNNNALPDSIYLYIVDQNNVVTDAVTNSLGTEVQHGVKYYDPAFPENTYYSFDITDFIQQEMGTIGMNKHALRLVFDTDNYTTTFHNLTFNDMNGRYPIELEIIYSIYESF